MLLSGKECRPDSPAVLVVSSRKAMDVLSRSSKCTDIEDIVATALALHSTRPCGYDN